MRTGTGERWMEWIRLSRNTRMAERMPFVGVRQPLGEIRITDPLNGDGTLAGSRSSRRARERTSADALQLNPKRPHRVLAGLSFSTSRGEVLDDTALTDRNAFPRSMNG
jgi:hypothetical protein